MRECPTPRKRRLSEARAYKDALSLSRRIGYGVRPYHCECGAWHLTRWAYPTKQQNEGETRTMSLPHCPDCTYSDVQEVWQSEPVEVLSVPCAKHQPPWWGTDARPTKHQNEHPLE